MEEPAEAGCGIAITGDGLWVMEPVLKLRSGWTRWPISGPFQPKQSNDLKCRSHWNEIAPGNLLRKTYLRGNLLHRKEN